MMTEGDQRGRRQEAQQTAHEGAAPAGVLGGEIADGVDRDYGEQDAHDRQDDQAERVDGEPIAEDGAAGSGPERYDEQQVRDRDGEQPAAAKPRRPVAVGNRGGQEREEHQSGEAHQSLSSVSRAELSESNSRLMWNTTIPMMNTPTNTSSSTPSSTRNGTRSAWLSPKT